MKNGNIGGPGAATLLASIAAVCVFAGSQQAFAEEMTSAGVSDFQIYDGPALLPPPINFGPVMPPVVPVIPPAVPVPETPPLLVSVPADPPNQSSVPQPPQPSPSPTSAPTPTLLAEDIAASSKPALISAPTMVYTIQLPAGSKVVTPAAKATLAKTAEAVKVSNKPASIAVKTAGTTVAKATAQAKAIVAELKKRGVSAVTVIKRVGKKTSVSVLVTKKKP